MRGYPNRRTGGAPNTRARPRRSGQSDRPNNAASGTQPSVPVEADPLKTAKLAGRAIGVRITYFRAPMEETELWRRAFAYTHPVVTLLTLESVAILVARATPTAFPVPADLAGLTTGPAVQFRTTPTRVTAIPANSGAVALRARLSAIRAFARAARAAETVLVATLALAGGEAIQIAGARRAALGAGFEVTQG